MSDADFQAAWTAFFAKASAYSTSQRGALLIGTKAHLNAALTEVGAPEKAAEKPAPAAASAGAAPAAAPAAAAPAKAEPVTGARVSTKVAHAPGGASSISLGDDGKSSSKTSVKVANAPGGGSSIQLGDDSTGRHVGDDHGNKPKKFTAGRKQLAPAGGHSHDIFGDGAQNQKTSVRTAQPAGGKSSISLGGDGGSSASPAASPTAAAAASAAAPAAAAAEKSDSGAGGDELTPALIAEISAAVYRKGKVKDTYTKLTQNKGKGLNQADLKEGMTSIIGVAITDAQAGKLLQKFAKDAAAGMSFPEFVKMLAV